MLFPKLDEKAEGLIFDLDGTLADSIPLHMQCWHETCKLFNYKVDESVFIRMTGMPTRKFAEYIKNDSGCDLTVEEIMKIKQSHFHRLAHTIKPIEKIAGFVKQNYGKIPMSIGTGGSRKSSTLILQAIDMLQYFDILVTADDVINHKPEPETFLNAKVYY